MSDVYYVDGGGNFLGGYDGSAPDGGTVVPSAPDNAAQHWNGTSWDPLTVKDYQIYSYVEVVRDSTALPDKINFITGLTRRLYPVYTYNFGEMQQTVFYATATVGAGGVVTYSTPVVQENFTYTRNATTGQALYRTNVISWYYTDGTLGSTTKTLTKYYDDPVAAINELARRNDNNLKYALGSVSKMALAVNHSLTLAGVTADGRAFFNTYIMHRLTYVNLSEPDIVTDIRNDVTISWFDIDISSVCAQATPRSYLIYQLTKGAQSS